MPIAGATPVLQSQILSALSMDKGAQTQIVATQIASSIAGVVPMGLFPPSFPMPLVPAGLSGGLSMIQNTLNLQQGASQKTVAQLIATGVSLIAPMAPPAGLSFLQSQIESALSLDKGARQQVVASLLATAIVSYYIMGGVL